MFNVVAYTNYICLPASCPWHFNSLRRKSVKVAGWGRMSAGKYSAVL